MRYENRIKLAELVRQQRYELMTLWRNKVQQVPAARNLDTPAACSHIDRLLDDMAAALMEGKNKSLLTVPVGGSTEVHGVQRFHEGFNLIEVVADYNALREAILEFAEANRLTATGRVRAIMDRVLDKAIGVAVQTYSEQRALEIERQREEHLSFIVHDLKTPLSAVATATLILQNEISKEHKTERIPRMLEIVQRNTERLNALITRVIREQKQLQRSADSVFAGRVTKRQVDLWPLIEELLHDLQTLTEPKGIRTSNEVPHSCSVFADPVLIVRVFQNLVSNAIKYRAPERPLELAITAARTGDAIEVAVADNGVGMDAAAMSRAFDPFFRVEHCVGRSCETPGQDVFVLGVAAAHSTFRSGQALCSPNSCYSRHPRFRQRKNSRIFRVTQRGILRSTSVNGQK